MARNRGKKALYEVMSKARARQGYNKTLEQMTSTKTEEVKPVAPPPKPAAKASKAVADWWKKPRIAQFNAGRFEFSVPYQVAIALGLVFVVLLLGSYRLGQNSVVPGQVAAGEPAQETGRGDGEATAGQATAGIEKPVIADDGAPPGDGTTPAEVVLPEPEEQTVPVKPKGENVIVLVQFGRMADLVPVQEHFAGHGIQTEINFRGGQYFLETVERYDNPANFGSNGFEAKKEIMRVGLLYEGKAPADLETFETHLFQDVYGRKVED